MAYLATLLGPKVLKWGLIKQNASSGSCCGRTDRASFAGGVDGHLKLKVNLKFDLSGSVLLTGPGILADLRAC